MLRRLALLCPLVLAACEDVRPCTSCPQIAGAYLVSWQRGVAQPDCPTTGPRPIEFNVTQTGNRVSALIGGDELRGTLYDTYDFSMTGGHSDTSYTLRGRAVVGGAADGGGSSVRLVGSLLTRADAATTGCQLQEAYTADRI